jgi:hypothetical protein
MNEIKRNIYKYNMSFYYQSTIIYMIVFIVYIIVRGEFFEGSYRLVTKDPIIYFFIIIILVSITAMLFNLYKNRQLEISVTGFAFVNRFRMKSIALNDIKDIKLFQDKKENANRSLRLIRIRLKSRKRPLIIRPYDYENESDLIKDFETLKSKLESSNV